MELIRARRILNKHCDHREEWHCGQVKIHLTGKDQDPRFDRRMEIFLDQRPEMVDAGKISRLLRFLARLGRKHEYPPLFTWSARPGRRLPRGRRAAAR
ncbi:MAG: hypothetical protein HY748_07570 [Elusimicrobia bacterium]|nr:hypothetical protein [Elusimicrobiota bacterium]